MIGADLVRAAMLLSIPAAALYGAVTLPLLYAVAVVTGLATVLYQLADHVFVTDLVGRKRVLDANGKREAADAVAEISGPALGGALVAWLTAPLAIAVDAATFVVSALLLSRIAKRETVAPPRQSSSFVDDVRTGIRVVWRDGAIRALFVATATLAFCMSFMASLYTLYCLSDLGLTPTQLGITIGCGGLGGLAGAALAAPASLRWGPRRTLIGALVDRRGSADPDSTRSRGAVGCDGLSDRDPGDRRRRADRLSRQRNHAAPAPAATRRARPRRGDVASRGRPADADRRAHGRRSCGDAWNAAHAVDARVRRCRRRSDARRRAPRVARRPARDRIVIPAAFGIAMPTPRPLPATMRYVAAREPGPPDVLAIAEGPVPKPKPGEVLIAVSYAGVNRPDCAQRAGTYPPPADASPIIGLEVAGEIVECGDGVTAWQIGDEVCALTPGGGYAEYCTTPAAFCLPIPKGLTLLEAASLPENFFTVWNNLFDRAHLARGESVLIHGGSSGIGLTAIQLAKQHDAMVITTVGSDEKAAYCRSLGADHAINYRTQDFVAEVARITAKRGVDVVLDMVGGDYIEKNLRSLALEGRLVMIAFLHGGRVEVDWRHIMMRRLTVTGSTLRASPTERKAAIANSLRAKVWPLLEAGVVKPVVHRVFPLAEAAAAHALMESSQHIGKIMLDVRG